MYCEMEEKENPSFTAIHASSRVCSVYFCCIATLMNDSQDHIWLRPDFYLFWEVRQRQKDDGFSVLTKMTSRLLVGPS